MSVFGGYSRYYDLIYRDKDYKGEVLYVEALIRRFRPHFRNVLELGCGTGIHAKFLADEGYCVHGVDLSVEMLEKAKMVTKGAPADQLSFSLGDIRTVRLERQFDCVVSLFHVISYQKTNADLRAAFETARCHLVAGGVFVFDCWYGPAVLAARPECRVKELENEEIRVLRIAEPQLHPNKNLVDVNYRIQITDKATGVREELRETHPMRYLFRPEVELLLELSGFRLVAAEAWMTGEAPGLDTWGVCYVAQLEE